MRLLFFTQNLPYPTNSGSRLRTRNLIEVLSEIGELKCIFAPFRGMDVDEFRKYSPIWLSYKIIHSVGKSRLMRGFEYFTSPILRDYRLSDELENEISSYRPDLIWIDYLFLAHYIPQIKKKFKIPVIYGTHNFQSDLTLQQSKTSVRITTAIKFRIMHQLHKLHERCFYKYADRLVCVSDADNAKHIQIIPSEKCRVVPNFVDFESCENVKAHREVKEYIVFVGSINNFQNSQGVIFFLEKIYPLVFRDPGAPFFLIVGRGAKSNPVVVDYERQYDNIKIYENVDSVLPYLKGAAVSIVPLLSGSGTRLKIIESMMCKTAVVSTSVGAEGIDYDGGKYLIVSDDPIEFAAHILDLLNNAQKRYAMAENAWVYGHKNFSKVAICSFLKREIANLNDEVGYL